MDLILNYIEAAQEMERVDSVRFTNKTTKLEVALNVRKHNRLADKLRSIAIKINKNTPELKEDFFQLIYHENQNVRGWAMFHVLEPMDYDFEHRKKAMKAILERREYDWELSDTWFKIWIREHPEFQELL